MVWITTAVHAILVLREGIVKLTLMSVISAFVKIMHHVKIEWTIINVTAPKVMRNQTSQIDYLI